MNVTKQYEHLVEMVAHARSLAAYSDNDKVSRLAEEVKQLGTDMAHELGVEYRHLTNDAVARYMQLNEEK